MSRYTYEWKQKEDLCNTGGRKRENQIAGQDEYDGLNRRGR